jgi:hypothetical protein
MDTGKTTAAVSPKRGWSERLRRMEKLVPVFAVGLVSVTAVVTALVVARQDAPDPALEQAEASVPKGVVQAPPLKTSALPPAEDQPTDKDASARPAASALGAALACRNCGVVEMVVAVHGYADPRASGYQMHIRMDDGSVRTVEQRGALAAGSRVIVERRSVRLLPRQG